MMWRRREGKQWSTGVSCVQFFFGGAWQPDDFERRGLDRRIIFTHSPQSVSDQFPARASCASSRCDDWGAGAGSTALEEPRAAFMDPGGTGSHEARIWAGSTLLGTQAKQDLRVTQTLVY
eukprot:1093154-Amphidinium_carterae.2